MILFLLGPWPLPLMPLKDPSVAKARNASWSSSSFSQFVKQLHCLGVTKYPSLNILKFRKVGFGSQFLRFRSSVTWPVALGLCQPRAAQREKWWEGLLISRKPKQKQRKGTRMWKFSFHEASPLTVSMPPLIPETGSEASTHEELVGNGMGIHSKCDLSDSCPSEGLLIPQRNGKPFSSILKRYGTVDMSPTI